MLKYVEQFEYDHYYNFTFVISVIMLHMVVLHGKNTFIKKNSAENMYSVFDLC